jgi:hypothetical protein
VSTPHADPSSSRIHPDPTPKAIPPIQDHPFSSV